jgi:integrase
VFEKGQRWVIYDFDRFTAQALVKWLDQRPPAAHDYVWIGMGSKYPQLKATGIRKMLSDVCAVLKLPHYTPHQIRHSAGEILANNDHSELAVASALNHQNLQSARHYMPKRLAHTNHLRQEIEATIYPDRVGAKEVPYLRIVERESHS